MYRDVAQWQGVRHRVLEQDTPIHQVVRETGIGRNTVRKMLRHPLPPPYGPAGGRARPKLGPHTSSVRRLLHENAVLPPSARLSIQAIYERLRDEEGFAGAYGTVKEYARLTVPDVGDIWERAYDLLISLERKRAVDFLFMLSRTEPPVISPERTERFSRETGPVVSVISKPDRRAQARQAAFEWMRAALQNGVDHDALRREVRDIPGFEDLLDRLHTGRLSDRNRAMVVLASHRGLSRRVICRFLGIGRNTCRKYLRAFAEGGHEALFARQR